MAKRGLRSEPVATRKRRHLAVDADTSSLTYTYGGAVAFKNAWKALLKGAWTSKPPPRQSRDDRFRYIRPGDDPAGKEGLDILLGESAVMRFVKVVAAPLQPLHRSEQWHDTGERRNNRNSGSRGRDDAGRGRGDASRGQGDVGRDRADDEPANAAAEVVNGTDCPLLVASPEVKPRREDAGEVEDVPVALPVVTEAMLGETKATSVSTLDVVEVTSGVGKLRTSLITLLQEGTEHTATVTPR
ncbi:hypothetical protein PC116_g21311 [Phytophthora cactorum]|nr:hypothetical protein PC112_g17032 [Phytophthora cactorum]KAG3078440.1 hypothetical protein PC122_g12697 [Phytophthora cactorum]KAG4230386.1 hypothetical protein PC116_g21311 [Phytophthora cactorum]